jgi:hypothetical protein
VERNVSLLTLHFSICNIETNCYEQYVHSREQFIPLRYIYIYMYISCNGFSIFTWLAHFKLVFNLRKEERKAYGITVLSSVPMNFLFSWLSSTKLATLRYWRPSSVTSFLNYLQKVINNKTRDPRTCDMEATPIFPAIGYWNCLVRPAKNTQILLK